MLIINSYGILAILFLQFIFPFYITHHFRKQNDKYVENLRWDFKVREQAARVAEYMAIARELKETDPPELYRKMNQLSWELAMWLPGHLYKSMSKSIVDLNDENNNPLTVVIAIREYLLNKKNTGLASEEILHHAPGIGRH